MQSGMAGRSRFGGNPNWTIPEFLLGKGCQKCVHFFGTNSNFHSLPSKQSNKARYELAQQYNPKDPRTQTIGI